MELTISDIATLTEGQKHFGNNAGDTVIEDLLTDSRSLVNPAHTLFFALTTESGDGHLYIKPLLLQGVRNFVVEHLPAGLDEFFSLHPEIDPESINFIISDNALRALQRLGRRAASFKGTRVGITGSNGKTTVKEWLYRLLTAGKDEEGKKHVARSPRSYNSQTGVPLSLWSIPDDTEIALIEAGVSREGEMEALAEMIQPDIAVLTSLGDEHNEGFTSLSRKAEEKARLVKPLTGKVAYSSDVEHFDTLMHAAAQSHGTQLFDWSRHKEEAYIRILSEKKGHEATDATFTVKGKEYCVSIPFTDNYEVEDVYTSIAALLALGFSPEKAIENIGELTHLNTRLNVTEGVNGCSVILDGYCADIPSLLPALDFMRRRAVNGQTHTLVLSDITEGEDKETAECERVYERLARLLPGAGVNRLIGVGPQMKRHSSLFPAGSQFFASAEECMQSLSPADFSNEAVLIKGRPGTDLSRFAENLEAHKHETVLEVNLDALVHNFNLYRDSLPAGTRLTAMVKAFGYGMGSYEIAKTLQEHGAAYLAVAVLDEGIELRERGITMPIMVMNPKVANYKSIFAYRLEPEIYSLEMLNDVVREAGKNGVRRYPLHIKLDTGMHRMGFIEEELEQVAETLRDNPSVAAASVFSHLATADCVDMDDYTLRQIENFKRMTGILARCLPYPFMRHILNSAGIIRFPQYGYDMARLGIGLYGVRTLPPGIDKDLKVVGALRTVVIAVREWKAGEAVGYGRKGLLRRDSRIATIPIGYADGMNRKFGNGAVEVLVNGRRVPTIGNICMDACMIDVTGVDVRPGDEVEIFGPEMPVERLAEVLGTIPYEIITSISPRVKRIYYRE